MSSIVVHDPPERLLAGVAAELGENHPTVRVMRTLIERLDESEKRQRDLEMRLDSVVARLDRNGAPR